MATPRPSAVYEDIQLHPEQEAVAQRLHEHLSTRPDSAEFVAPAGFGKTRVVGTAVRTLPAAEAGKTHLVLWVTQSAPLARTHASEMGAQFNVKMKELQLTATRTSNVVLSLSHNQFAKLISTANLEGMLSLLRCHMSNVTVVLDESQQVYGRSGAIMKRAISIPNPTEKKAGPGWVKRFRDACSHVCILSVTATDALDGAPAKLIEHRKTLLGEFPMRVVPTADELAAHAVQLTKFPSLSKRETRHVEMKHSVVSASMRADMSKLVLGRLLFGVPQRTAPFRGMVDDRLVEVTAISEDGATLDVTYEDDAQTATVDASSVRTLGVSKMMANRAITNLAYEMCITDLVDGVKKPKCTLPYCFTADSLAATKEEEQVQIRDHAVVFLNSEYAVAFLVNKLSEPTEDSAGQEHPSRYVSFVLTADDTKNAQLLDKAHSIIQDASSDKIVLIFSHSSMRQGVNFFAPIPPAQVCIIGFESPTTLTQIEGRFGRFTEQIDVPVVNGGKIGCTYFESEVVGQALQLPSDKPRRAQLMLLTVLELRNMLGAQAPTDGSVNKHALVNQIIMHEQSVGGAESQGRASSRKRRGGPRAEEDPLKAVDDLYRGEFELAETAQSRLGGDASEEDREATKAAVSDAQKKLECLAHHRQYLRQHPLVAMELIKDLYVACATDEQASRAFQVEYFCLVQQKLAKPKAAVADEVCETEAAAEEESDETDEAHEDMTLQAAIATSVKAVEHDV